jgi:hypothetical protein
MKTISRIVPLLCAALIILIIGCGGNKKTEAVPVGQMTEYRDASLGYRLQYPSEWKVNGSAGRVQFYSAEGVDQRFLEPTGAFPDGAALMIEITPTHSPDSMWNAQVAELSKQGFIVDKPFPVAVAGKPANQVNYTGHYTPKIKEVGHHVFISLDTVLYDLRFAGFGDLHEAYKAVFAAMTASFQLPKPPEKGRDQTLPSEAMSEYSTQFFTFQYPDNYNFTNPPKGSNDLVLELRGPNLSTSIRFDVFSAKGLTLQKVFDQNRGRFPGNAVSGKASLGGQEAMTLTYAPTGQVERRIYFIVKNDKVFRITLDWVKAERQDYLATYDKVISSIKFK